MGTTANKTALLTRAFAILVLSGVFACSSGSVPMGSADASLVEDAGLDSDAETADAGTEAICGDGIVESPELCDDGEREAGDGCDADCELEIGYACSGAPSLCAPECGDSMMIAPEECDDGDTDSTDGCSEVCEKEAGYSCPVVGQDCLILDGSCDLPFEILLTDNSGVLEGSVTTDTTGGSNSVPEASCDGQIVGEGTDNSYSFTLPDTRDLTIEAQFSTDGLVRVLTDACSPSTTVPGEIAFGDSCANQVAALGTETLTLNNLPPGTYYIVVDGVSLGDQSAIVLDISASVTSCGDGVRDANEECDDINDVDGDGCSRCVLDPFTLCSGMPSICTPTCGDGIVDAQALEECDDGNTTDDDRCSDLCSLNADVLDSEDNNSFATAQPLDDGQVARGSINPTGGDVFDLYTFTIAAPTWVFLEQYNTVNGNTSDYSGSGSDNTLDCHSDLQLRIFDGMGAPTDNATALLFNDDSGDGLCGYLGANTLSSTLLPSGTYFVKVNDYNDDTAIPLYALDLQLEAPLALGDACVPETDLCDSLLSCDATSLQCEALCGNGILDAAEECDDGNLVDNDRCSDTCGLNADVIDTEDNNSVVTAQSITPGQVARGSIDPTGSDPFDLYTFTLSAPSWVTLEEYNTVDGDLLNYTGAGVDNTLDCNSDIDLRLFHSSGDPTDNTTAIVTDDFAGDGTCGYIGSVEDGSSAFLPAGTYYIKVTEFGDDATIPLYALDFQLDAPLAQGDSCEPSLDLCNPGLSCAPGTLTCRIPAPASIDRASYEQFSTGEFDLSDTSILFSSMGGSYGVISSASLGYPDTPGSGTVTSTTLVLGDDDSLEVALSSPFPYFGVDENSVFIGSNGFLSFGTPSDDASESVADHFLMPRISFFFDDLDPSSGGTLTMDEYADHATITFDAVPAFGSANSVSAQVQLWSEGSIVITYLSVTETDCLIGLSAGDNESNPPSEIDFSSQIPVAANPGDLVINEFLANGAGADSNCDVVSDSTDDEFIELVNVSGVVLDLSGLRISDGVGVKHIFGATLLPQGRAIVVYGGGTSMCPGVLGQVASSGSLGLNNAGDSITLSTGDSITYGSSTAGISRTLNAELAGPDFINHNFAGGSSTNFSPGFRANGEAF